MKIVLNISIIIAVLLFAAYAAFAHGPAGDSGGLSMMSRMMEMMHGNIDANKSVDCKTLSGAELMEHGEEMMEQMMGHEDHERVEEAMEKDMQDHDAMHIMMGMWATGCVGDETMASLMDRGGITERLEALERNVQNQVGWPAAAMGIVIGAIAGWMGSQLFRKKPPA
jgi:hypothetical protein